MDWRKVYRHEVAPALRQPASPAVTAALVLLVLVVAVVLVLSSPTIKVVGVIALLGALFAVTRLRRARALQRPPRVVRGRVVRASPGERAGDADVHVLELELVEEGDLLPEGPRLDPATGTLRVLASQGIAAAVREGELITGLSLGPGTTHLHALVRDDGTVVR